MTHNEIVMAISRLEMYRRTLKESDKDTQFYDAVMIGLNALSVIKEDRDYLKDRVKELDRNGGVRAPGSGDRIQELQKAIKHFSI